MLRYEPPGDWTFSDRSSSTMPLVPSTARYRRQNLGPGPARGRSSGPPGIAHARVGTVAELGLGDPGLLPLHKCPIPRGGPLRATNHHCAKVKWD